MTSYAHDNYMFVSRALSYWVVRTPEGGLLFSRVSSTQNLELSRSASSTWLPHYQVSLSQSAWPLWASVSSSVVPFHDAEVHVGWVIGLYSYSQQMAELVMNLGVCVTYTPLICYFLQLLKGEGRWFVVCGSKCLWGEWSLGLLEKGVSFKWFGCSI